MMKKSREARWRPVRRTQAALFAHLCAGSARILCLTLTATAFLAGCSAPPERPARLPMASTSAEASEPAPEVSGVVPAQEGATPAVTVRVDPTTGGLSVAISGQTDIPLGEILDRAYAQDAKATSSTVAAWLLDNKPVVASTVRDLIEKAWEQNKEDVRQVIRPWFTEHMTLEIEDIPTLLSQAWDHDIATTRSAILKWGKSHGIGDLNPSADSAPVAPAPKKKPGSS